MHVDCGSGLHSGVAVRPVLQVTSRSRIMGPLHSQAREEELTDETAASVHTKFCLTIKTKCSSWVVRWGRSLLTMIAIIGPILWGHSGPLCHALSLLLWTSILHCHSPGIATVARRLRYSWLRLILVLVVSTVTTPVEWQCKIRTGGVRRLAVANGPNNFQMLLVC